MAVIFRWIFRKTEKSSKGNLDSKTGKEIMDLLKLLNSEGQTILMVTHNADNAKFAHGVIYLKDGKLQG
jgi:ABC-type lipoprotein export system ATPase subunit